MTITVSNLGKRFNREWIFRGLTAKFTPGNIYAITGPNGSGKSTLMQVLWGQVPPSEGIIEFKTDNGHIALEDAFKHISLATPYMDLLEDLTLQEHLEFHFTFKKPMSGLSAQDLMLKLEMAAAANKPIKQFSSGMKQRLKLGLALFSDSEVLFLDEPTTNLDEAASSWYRNNLKAVANDKVVFIATNQASDYPNGSIALDLSTLKQVTQSAKAGIQPVQT